MEAAAVRGRFLDRKRRRNARLDDRYRLGSAFAFKGASLDPFSYSMSRTASNTPQPSMIQRAMFTCNATPIAHLPRLLFYESIFRHTVGRGDLGQFKVVRRINAR
jgi:hypothetical protein